MKNVLISMEELAPLIRLQLQKGGHASLTVTGNSMYPMLRHRRDMVYLQPADPVQKKGDLILYQREEGSYILHRIVRCKAPGEYICSGDNQWEPEAVSQGQVIAKVYAFRRKGKEYQHKSRSYRLYVWIWVALFPVRKPIFAMRHFLGRIYRKLAKKQ